jgi:hypothetical protein
MKSSITLNSDERKTLLDYLRRHPQPEIRLRAHIILLLADGHTWELSRTVLFCSTRTIARWKERFEQGRRWYRGESSLKLLYTMIRTYRTYSSKFISAARSSF